MIKDWVMIASHRQNRPNMPSGCPFCPGSGKVPEQYEVLKYDNDFPALSQNPPAMDFPATENVGDLYRVAPAYGKCEVVLFSPDHYGKIYELSRDHMNHLVDLWCERFADISSDKNIKYVFIFENRGEVVGVTMQHPHGQIYGYSVVPKKIELEMDSCKEYHDAHGECLFCAMNREEQAFAQRVICENEDFVAYIPFFADYAYGVYISAKAHKGNICEFTASEKENLGKILQQITGAYDNIFDTTFPYMMCMHNAPVNCEEEYPGSKDYYHFHIEMYPPMRAADKQQFQASSETGVWAHCNPTAPEAKAEELRAALAKFEAKR